MITIKTLKSPCFSLLWAQHFLESVEIKQFEHLQGIEFHKNNRIPLYTNLGNRITQGISYGYQPDIQIEDNSVQLIYDVPVFDKTIKTRGFPGAYSSQQYLAYAIDLKGFKDADSYIKQHLSRNTRYQIRRALKRFNFSFKVQVEFVTGVETTSKSYVALMERFFEMVDRRFNLKGDQHVFQGASNRAFFKELIPELLKINEAVMMCIWADGELIAMNLNYRSENALILSLPVFDPDYSKFKIGHLATYYSIDYCLSQKLRFYDFSKGYYDYKKQWGNLEYHFEYHLFYDQRSLKSKLLAFMLFQAFQLKKGLRALGIVGLKESVSKLLGKGKPLNWPTFEIQDGEQTSARLPVNPEEIPGLKRLKNDFLFSKQEKNDSVSTWETADKKYVIRGQKHSWTVKPHS